MRSVHHRATQTIAAPDLSYYEEILFKKTIEIVIKDFCDVFFIHGNNAKHDQIVKKSESL
ncbi:22767_t:CDS:2 [Dentiscutata erythropus]|uniref:22767_t:CDS:1 n=1 Tax=Dentiscutata erythropus TaxID=1348616 RepID=A0A9N9G2G1_9GLOM|nr:22767_t:CDS:2 [Dentiscutata erythropus]